MIEAVVLTLAFLVLVLVGFAALQGSFARLTPWRRRTINIPGWRVDKEVLVILSVLGGALSLTSLYVYSTGVLEALSRSTQTVLRQQRALDSGGENGLVVPASSTARDRAAVSLATDEVPTATSEATATPSLIAVTGGMTATPTFMPLAPTVATATATAALSATPTAPAPSPTRRASATPSSTATSLPPSPTPAPSATAPRPRIHTATPAGAGAVVPQPSPTASAESMPPATTAPAAPLLLRPLDGELVIGSPGFAWAANGGLTEGGRYELQLWPFQAEPRGVVQTTETAWFGALELVPGIYHWRVRVLDGENRPVAESEAFTFTWQP